MRKFVTLILALFAFAKLGNAQVSHHKHVCGTECKGCYASGKVERKRIAPPADFLLKSGAAAKSNIIVEYEGFPEEVLDAFQYAVDIWETLIESDMPIRMKARWRTDLDDNVLGSCSPEAYYQNFRDAPYKDRYYAVAVAEKIANEELNGESRYDIVANFSNKIDWYFGTDMNCPDTQYDFVTVVLHEIGHGLGFTGFFGVNGDNGVYGYLEYGDATSFDLLVQSPTFKDLVDTSYYENSSAELKKALESVVMYANSPIAQYRNNWNKPRLYAPLTFDSGSSVYHLNESTYANDPENALMTPFVGKAEVIHNPGPLTLGILDDIGWRNIFIRFDQVKDIEELKPLVFSGTFESNYGVEAETPKVVYSLDGFEDHSDTLLLVDDGTGTYSATLTPDSETDNISYYIEVQDTLSRKRCAPSLAPKEVYTINIGTDTENPTIEHEEIPYFLLRGEELEIKANVYDNLGIDTVYVEYQLNGEDQGAFPLLFQYDDLYSGVFPIDINSLKDGDEISYLILASDEAQNKNSSRLPKRVGYFTFRVEEIFDAVSQYSNDFNGSKSDFVISDFDIYTAGNFENGALHSLHPYTSPGVDNQDIDFFTFLKKPIVVKENGLMTFDEVVLVEPGNTGSVYGDDDFFDYVVVEASEDYGETWRDLADGYDCTSNEVWNSNYNTGIPANENDSETEGKAEWYVTREINLTENGNFEAGDTILIRFRLYSDPYAAGWGWAIDNLKIQQPVSANTILSTGNILVYPNPFEDKVTVSISSIKQSADIKIDVYNMFGQKVYSLNEVGAFGELHEEIDLSGKKSGMFLVQVSQDGKVVLTRKLIKN